MRNYLANLFQRGAGLGPWSAASTGGIKPEPYTGLSYRDSFTSTDIHSDTRTLLPGNISGTHPIDSSSKIDSDNLPKTPSVDIKTEDTVIKEDIIDSATPPYKEKPLIPVEYQVDEEVGFREKPDTGQLHSAEYTKIQPRKMPPIEHTAESIHKNERQPDNIENPTSSIDETDMQKPMQKFYDSIPPLVEMPANIHAGIKKRIGQSYGSSFLQPVNPQDRPADFIKDDLKTPIYRKTEIPTGDLNKTSIQLFNLQEKSASGVDRDSFGPARISAKESPSKTAVKTVSAINTGNRKTTPSKPEADQVVQVRIGKVEVRTVRPSKNPTLPKNPVTRPVGFDEYYSMRNYSYREP